MADQRYNGKPEEQKSSFLGNIARTGATAGAGFLAYKNRAAIGRTASRATSDLVLHSSRVLGKDGLTYSALSDARMFMKAASDSLGDNPSVIRTLRAGFDGNVSRKMDEGFQLSLQNSIEKRSLNLNRPGTNETRAAGRYHRLFHENSTKGLDRFKKAATDSFRDNRIIEELAKKSAINKQGAGKIAQALMDYKIANKDFLSKPANHVSEFTKQLETGAYKGSAKFEDDTLREAFQKQLLDTLEPFSSRSKVFKDNEAAITLQAKNMRSAASFSFIKEQLEETSLIGKGLEKRGFAKVTLKDTESMSDAEKRKHGMLIDEFDEHDDSKVVDVSKELRKFLNVTKNDKDVNKLLQDANIKFDFDDIVLDKHLYRHKETGEVIDNRHVREGVATALDTFQESVKVPFLNINPLDLTPWQAFRSGQAKEGLHVLSAGQMHGYVRNLAEDTFETALKDTHQDAIRNPLKNSNHFYTGGNVFRYTEAEGLSMVDEGLYLMPSQFGGFSRMHANQTNTSALEKTDERGFLGKLFDLGHQESESRFETYKKAVTKFGDSNYGPNIIKSLVHQVYTDGDGQADHITKAYNQMRVAVDKNTTSLSREATEVLAPHVNELFSNIKVHNEAFDFARLSDDDYVREASVVFQRELTKPGTNVGMYRVNNRSVYDENLTGRTEQLQQDPAAKELIRQANKYMEDPRAFKAAREAAIDRRLPSGMEFMIPSLGDQEPLITATEKLRRSFHQYAMRTLDNEAGDFSSDVAGKGVRRRSSIAKLEEARDWGQISNQDIVNAKDLELYSDLLGYGGIHDVKDKSREAKTFFNDILKPGGKATYFDESAILFEGGNPYLTDLGHELQGGMFRAQPIFGKAPEASLPSPNGADFILMRKSGLGKAGREIVSELNINKLNDFGPVDDAWDLAINAEMYGRNATKTLVQQGSNIINEMFAGRKAYSENLGDVTTATALLYGGAERLNNQLGNWGLSLSQKHLGTFQSIIGNQYARRIALPIAAYQQAVYFDGLTGDTVSDTAADAYVTTHETLNDIKNITGINKALGQWSKVFQNAGADQIGEWMGVKQLDFLTMGMFSDFRSGEEVRDYYESGETAIRKNRYWGIGSPSPWAGGGIDHFEANWYRKLKSDYKFTDTMYGDEGEYWSNHWMPTLTNPLAPLKHFVTDPYHYEKKHELDRPYAITGGFSEIQNIPLIGPVVDGTIGRILKPRKEHKGLERAHEEYIAAINQKIQDNYSPVHDGSYVGISGTGAVEQYNMYANQGTGELFGGTAANYGVNSGVVNDGNFMVPTYHNSNQPSGGYGSGMGAPGGFGTGGGSGTGGGTATDAARQMLAMQNYALSQVGDGVTAEPIGRLQKAKNQLLPERLSSIGTIDNLQGMALDGFYSGSELAGIYGFMTKSTISYNESWRGITLAPSTLMTSPSRSFWDMNLGGAGGSLSEIGRRYAPRDPNKDYYSPIRNTMPDWLPGVGEPTDFLHGDPYVKLQKGEIRLPGKAYEKLYKLHADGTGRGDFANYGVFDRFRILADVAPDSEQYEVAKHQISLLRQSGGITAEMDKEFDEITKQVHDKQDTYRWYDKKFSNSQINKEDVTITEVLDANTFMVREFDAPIRLAGVKLTQKDNADAIEWMGQFIKVGEKVKIGYADDPESRYNKDTYGTMSAVVYTNKNEEGRFWFETSKGQSLNALLANKIWKNKVQTKDNGSATSTQALYSKDMITVGKYTEMLTHDILPKIPFVGILADKFLQVRTPIESYKRDQVYGTDWRPWNQPYTGWIKPMINTVASQNPLIAGAEMAAIGHLWGKNSPKARGIGRIAGFALGAATSSLRVFGETAGKMIPGGDNIWLPQEREDEREINQYFDRLKYVKYRGLYEQASKIAKAQEGVDVNEFFDAAAEKAKKNKGLKRFLTDKKKTLSLSKKRGYGDSEAVESQIDELSMGIEAVSSAKEAYQAGRYTSLAIKYRKEYEGTLYGMAESGSSDRTALMRALTPKEREYVPRFLETTSSKERREILKYVPEDVKRILQGTWGLDPEAPETINSYFDKHYLPGENWSGWNAASNLDDIKIKVMKKEGINPTTSGYWAKDQARAEESGERAIPIHALSSLIDRNRLSEVLSGMGLSDVDVQLTTSYGKGPGGVNTSINIMKDVRGEILDTLNEGKHSLF